jgi:hypothetical protein
LKKSLRGAGRLVLFLPVSHEVFMEIPDTGGHMESLQFEAAERNSVACVLRDFQLIVDFRLLKYERLVSALQFGAFTALVNGALYQRFHAKLWRKHITTCI